MPLPYKGPTSRRGIPRITSYADGAFINIAQTGYAYHTPMVSYVVQPGDRLQDVTRTLYGSNTPENRAKVRNAGFRPGNIIHVPARTP